MIRSAESGAAEINFFGFSNPFPILPEGVRALWEDFYTNERKRRNQGRLGHQKNEALGADCPLPSDWKRVPRLAGTQEFLGTSEKICSFGCQIWHDAYFGFVKRSSYPIEWSDNLPAKEGIENL